MQSRQEIFIGKEKQEKLHKSTAAIVGLGGTGHAAAQYLARSGVSLIIVDNDVVEKCNLGRQAYSRNDIGKPKAIVLKERLYEFCNIEARQEILSSNNIDTIMSKADIILDGTDNFKTRFVINDYGIKHEIPFTYAAAIRSEAAFMMWLPGRPCLRCVFSGKKVNDSCEKDGVLAPVPAFIGTLSAIEAIKYFIDKKPVEGLMTFDFFKNKFGCLNLKKEKICVCSGQEEI